MLQMLLIADFHAYHISSTKAFAPKIKFMPLKQANSEQIEE